MSNRIRLKVLGLSYSQLQSGAYALLLSEDPGPHKIPIVIGAAEAQSIAIRIEGITPLRPLTHDLFAGFTHAFGIRLLEVFIYKFEDGIFYSELSFTDGSRTVQLDARTSDAVAIAMRTHAPIYTTREVIDTTGFIISDNDISDNGSTESDESGSISEATDISVFTEPRLENYTVDELQRTLDQLTEDENYEEAARVNEILQNKLRKLRGEDSTDSQTLTD